ncbi:MAG: hypothetical protein IAE77_05405 [Prosthecobacter sp.]|jgi:hypothetical protein|uniref:hypothetical protein n=1 Tax=Prosthecobacter sp. TaxID=1965333 RepID=UPI0019FDC302|nr:hypothetical protein [Prosthecobacter sp.]MBE2282880.1 hypothetical protein [Prosthecobacter sp.]
MSHPAKTLSEATVNCSPRPLTNGAIADFWVETSEARDHLTCFRINVRNILEQPVAQRILVFGHRGCGKSTELNKVISELGPEWLPVTLVAGDYLPVSGNQAADVLLAACTRMIEVSRDNGLSLSEAALEPVVEFFNETTSTQHETRSSDLEVGAGINTSSSLLDKLIGLSAKFTSALKFGSRTDTSTVSKVRQRKGELMASVNALAVSMEQAWRTKTEKSNAKVLLIIEDLDKLGLADARHIFVNDGRLLGDIAVRAIYTVPVFTFHSPEASSIKSYFDHTIGLPMIKTYTRHGKPCEEGRTILRTIIRRRVAEDVLPKDAMELLIERTGGVLRDIFDAIQSCAQFLPVQKSKVIDKESIKAALNRMVATIGLQIGYPPEEKKSPKPLQQRLADIARAQAAGREVATEPDPDLQYLLMSGALIEYNGDRWLGVHPLAKDYLRELGLDAGIH